MKVNAYVASKVLAPKVEPTTGGRRQHGEPKSDRYGSFTSAGWKRQHGGKDMPSNRRSPPRSCMALLPFVESRTPSLTAQGEQRRSSIFNNDRDIPIHRPQNVRFYVRF
jgi:hypothetical protein